MENAPQSARVTMTRARACGRKVRFSAWWREVTCKSNHQNGIEVAGLEREVKYADLTSVGNRVRVRGIRAEDMVGCPFLRGSLASHRSVGRGHEGQAPPPARRSAGNHRCDSRGPHQEAAPIQHDGNSHGDLYEASGRAADGNQFV